MILVCQAPPGAGGAGGAGGDGSPASPRYPTRFGIPPLPFSVFIVPSSCQQFIFFFLPPGVGCDRELGAGCAVNFWIDSYPSFLCGAFFLDWLLPLVLPKMSFLFLCL